MIAFILIPFFNEDLQFDIPAGQGFEAVFDTGEIPGDKGEEIGGLRMRIMPCHRLPPVNQRYLLRQVAV